MPIMHVYLVFPCISEANVIILCKKNPSFCEVQLSNYWIQGNKYCFQETNTCWVGEVGENEKLCQSGVSAWC